MPNQKTAARAIRRAMDHMGELPSNTATARTRAAVEAELDAALVVLDAPPTHWAVRTFRRGVLIATGLICGLIVLATVMAQP